MKSISTNIENRIFLIRSQKVMIDRDLAELYGVSTKRLNEQVKRNKKRFPNDFMFKLAQAETGELVANCDRLKVLKHTSSWPYVFPQYLEENITYSFHLNDFGKTSTKPSGG